MTALGFFLFSGQASALRPLAPFFKGAAFHPSLALSNLSLMRPN
jgi:hypothetical protein